MKKIILCLVLLLTLTGCKKTPLIEESDFKEGLKNAIKSEANEESYKAKYEDGKMKLSLYDLKYNVDVELEDEVSFTYTVKVKNGMSYDDYMNEINALSIPMFGYVAAVNTFDVDADDAAVYFAQEYTMEMLDFDTDYKYIVVYDEAEKDMYTDEYTVITVDEFGDHVVDFVKDSFGKEKKFTDKEKTFTYELSSTCKKDECTIVSKVTVDDKADYKDIKGYYKKTAMESMDSEITPENAEINVEIAVGQTAKLKTSKRIDGYGMAGMECYEFSFDYTEIKGLKEGVANGTLTVGDEEKTIYITVTKGNGKEKMKEITIK